MHNTRAENPHVEKSSCGVGFVASLRGESDFENLRQGLRALVNLEHRGGSGKDPRVGDGAGIMTDIPYKLFGADAGDAVASLFLPRDATHRVRSLRLFEETFHSLGLEVYRYREVPVNPRVLSPEQQRQRPELLMAFIRRPPQCTTRLSFEKMLYSAKQLTRSRLREAGIVGQFFFTSLSAGTVVYKALVPSRLLAEFYLDLQDPAFGTRFALFHRRFSTNTSSSWDKAQPFRLVAHNGEINTISGNRGWAFARERALGLREDELLTHRGISDSGSVNEMIEALMFRSSLPHAEDILAILMPQASNPHSFCKFWGRAMEPWDGPALFTFCDARTIGARLDRNGFRPCRWSRTESHFYLSSEAGSFEIAEKSVLAKGSLTGGGSVSVDLKSGQVHFKDAHQARENFQAAFEPRTVPLERLAAPAEAPTSLHKLDLFGYTDDDVRRMLVPMAREGKEPIGSMGDTARPAFLSEESRPLFDHFFQSFAQVTNPPLDYLREKLVTDMSVVLGRKPNIFEPKELIPPKLGIELAGPVLTLGQVDFLKGMYREAGVEGPWVGSLTLDMTFPRCEGAAGLRAKLAQLAQRARAAVYDKKSIFILSDRLADAENLPIPSVLALSSLVNALAEGGLRLRASIVVDTGEVRDTHGLAVLMGYGASAVCPYLALELAREGAPRFFGDAPDDSTPEERELRLVAALESGLLKVMSKMGVSVLSGYQGAELFSILGLSESVHEEFFPRQASRLGGLTLEDIVRKLHRPRAERGPSGLAHTYQYREHPKGEGGEKHSMTVTRSRLIHAALKEAGLSPDSIDAFGVFLQAGLDLEPLAVRHLLRPRPAREPAAIETVQPREEILRTFGSGAMSFGAISAESQRDIILAMREIGGRSNSGEGGENPYYETDGITADIKQVASGRFGVTAEYLVTGREIQIKIAQGAKPGEGGQLMAAKVGPQIARARHSDEGVDLISPPPMHDIYSIEDLKQLIYELRQVSPEARVSVKLVSGDNLGTIAVGVAKAGADIVHISGHDGGTGAAGLSSMKHAGLPWEFGLWEAHRALAREGLRSQVTLRVDGGLSSGRDIVLAALLGAEEFDFGKLLLVAEGCIMARVCEKNTCPAGIASHDPVVKKRYKGNKDKVVALLQLLAEDTRRELARLNMRSLSDVTGRADLLEPAPDRAAFARAHGLDLSFFLGSGAASPVIESGARGASGYRESVSELNQSILNDVGEGALARDVELSYPVKPADRAVLATLSGRLAMERARRRQGFLESHFEEALAHVHFRFTGSAGQGFAAFLQEGFRVRLCGEGNDSVAKSMSGGRLTVVPHPEARFAAHRNALIGNCALYGATGGVAYFNGLAGARFAVRNSGATAVVEGVGLHACEYMTRGRVVILGATGANVGAGMTGGELYLPREHARHLNGTYVRASDLNEEDLRALRALLEDYLFETDSSTAKALLEQWGAARAFFVKAGPQRLQSREAPVSLTKARPPEVRLA